MKVLLVNKRYFPSTGPETYLFNMIKMLQQDGHEAIPFSVNRDQNVHSKYSKYFVNHPAGKNSLFYKDYKINPVQSAKIFFNAIYSFDARKNIEHLINDEKPDIIYTLSIVNDLSPSLVHSAKKHNIPVVMRVSDYNLLCPEYRFLRDGKICTKCREGNYLYGLTHKCVQGRLLPSLTRVMALYVHKWLEIYKDVNLFITPSAVMRDQMIKAGFLKDKIFHIPSFVSMAQREPEYSNDGYILYFGRISFDKGLNVLLEAIKKVDAPLYIVGESTDDSGRKLQKYVNDQNLNHVTFLGFKKGEELDRLIKKAKFTILPSIWLENLPLTLLESMVFGKPTIGSNIGGIAEIIEDGKTGLLFEQGNIDDLACKINSLLSNPELIVEMGKNARKKVVEKYSSEIHYNKVKGLFEEIIQETDV